MAAGERQGVCCSGPGKPDLRKGHPASRWEKHTLEMFARLNCKDLLDYPGSTRRVKLTLTPKQARTDVRDWKIKL